MIYTHDGIFSARHTNKYPRLCLPIHTRPKTERIYTAGNDFVIISEVRNLKNPFSQSFPKQNFVDLNPPSVGKECYLFFSLENDFIAKLFDYENYDIYDNLVEPYPPEYDSYIEFFTSKDVGMENIRSLVVQSKFDFHRIYYSKVGHRYVASTEPLSTSHLSCIGFAITKPNDNLNALANDLRILTKYLNNDIISLQFISKDTIDYGNINTVFDNIYIEDSPLDNADVTENINDILKAQGIVTDDHWVQASISLRFQPYCDCE